MQESPNKTIGWNGNAISGIVIHYTASESLKSSYSWFMNPTAKASAHVIIDHNGTIAETVSTKNRAWHAGNSSWGGRTGCNNFTLGIEVVNVGQVTSVIKDGKELFYTYLGDRLDGEKVYDLVTKKYYEVYYEAQINSVLQLLDKWQKEFSISPSHIIGHSHVSPGRKVDPGPVFPWKLVDNLFGNRDIDIKKETLALQSHLERLDYEVGTIDGAAGPITKEELRQFILDYKLFEQTKSLVTYSGNKLISINDIRSMNNLLRNIPWKGYVSF